MSLLMWILVIIVIAIVASYFGFAVRKQKKEGFDLSEKPIRSILTFDHSKAVG